MRVPIALSLVALTAMSASTQACDESSRVLESVIEASDRMHSSIVSLKYSCRLRGTTSKKGFRAQEIQQEVKVLAGHRKVTAQHNSPRGGWLLDDDWGTTLLTPDILIALELDKRVGVITSSANFRDPAKNSKLQPVLNPFYCECALFWCGDEDYKSSSAAQLVSQATAVDVDAKAEVIVLTHGSASYEMKYSKSLDYAICEYSVIEEESLIEYKCADFFEAFPEVWLPRSFTRTVYYQNLEENALHGSLHAVEFNSLSERDFSFVPPPGSLTVNRDTGIEYFEPDNGAFFQQRVAAFADYYGVNQTDYVLGAIRLHVAFLVFAMVVGFGYLLLSWKVLG